jgi:hypothetical protein
MYSGHRHAERRYADIWRGIQRYAMDPVQPACMIHLTRHTGVSKRTLRNVCKRFTDLPPIGTHKVQADGCAHEMPCRADSSSTTVTNRNVLRIRRTRALLCPLSANVWATTVAHLDERLPT